MKIFVVERSNVSLCVMQGEKTKTKTKLKWINKKLIEQGKMHFINLFFIWIIARYPAIGSVNSKRRTKKLWNQFCLNNGIGATLGFQNHTKTPICVVIYSLWWDHNECLNSAQFLTTAFARFSIFNYTLDSKIPVCT